MKLNYEKPFIAIEYFELSQSIASCVTKIGFVDNMCVMNDQDAPLGMKRLAVDGYFASGCYGSAYTGDDSENGICYHTSSNAAFSS